MFTICIESWLIENISSLCLGGCLLWDWQMDASEHSILAIESLGILQNISLALLSNFLVNSYFEI